MLDLTGCRILDTMRTQACTVSNLEQFYNSFTELEANHNFHQALLFNLDETSITFCQKERATVCRKDDTRPGTAHPNQTHTAHLV